MAGNGSGKQQSVAGNVDTTYAESETGAPKQPVTDAEGNTLVNPATADDVRAGTENPSDTVYEALNGGSSTDPASSISVTAFGGNSDPVDLRFPSGDVYPLSAGEEQNISLDDVAKIEAQTRTATDQIKWVHEVNN